MKPSKKVTTIGRRAPNMVFSIGVVLDHRAFQMRRNAQTLLGGDRILFEKFGDQSRVEISSNAYDLGGLEREDPTVTIVESHAVPCRRQGMKFDHCLVAFDDKIFQVELSSLWKHLTQFCEGTGDKVCLVAISTGERMSAHHGPIDVVGHVCEKGGSVAVLQTFKYFTNVVRCNSHRSSP